MKKLFEKLVDLLIFYNFENLFYVCFWNFELFGNRCYSMRTIEQTQKVNKEIFFIFGSLYNF